MSNNESGRYSEQEALHAQSLATEREDLEFSEQASSESYAEAEKVIEQLRDEKFDWLGINWDNVDVASTNTLIESQLRRANDFFKFPQGPRTKHLAPWALAASTFLAGCGQEMPGAEAQQGYEEQLHRDYQEATTDTTIDVGVPFPPESDESLVNGDIAIVQELRDWKSQHPEVQKIVAGDLRPVADGAELSVTLFLKDGQTQVITATHEDLLDKYRRYVNAPDRLDSAERTDRRLLQYDMILEALGNYSPGKK